MGLIKKKLKSKRGESLTETLSSLLIIVPAMVMLAGAIVSAAKINSEARSSMATKYPELSFSASDKVGDSGFTKESGDIPITSGNIIKWYQESDSIYLYFR